MQRKSLAAKIREIRNKLQADEKQMARHMRLSLADYLAIESGRLILPLPAQKTLEKRAERLLDVCGLT